MVATGAISKSGRLRRGEFQSIFQLGRRVEQPSLLLLWRRVEGPGKAGFTVSRQVQGVVFRNRARRRLREAYRASGSFLPSRVQVVFVARPGALDGPFDRLCRDIADGLEVIAGQCRAAEGR